jgi:hypothetical protein
MMYVTEDGGVTWEELLLPATRADAALAALPDGFLVAGSASTIVRVHRRDVTGIPAAPAPAAGALALSARVTADGQVAATFTLGAAGKVDLAVIDVLGRRVATIAHGEFPAHTSITRSWDGRTAYGEPTARGVYFVRLQRGQEVRAAKVVVTR